MLFIFLILLRTNFVSASTDGALEKEAEALSVPRSLTSLGPDGHCEDRFFMRLTWPSDAIHFMPTYGDAESMRYFGAGTTLSLDVVCARITNNSLRSHKMIAGDFRPLLRWTIITYGGIAGSVCICRDPDEEKWELIYFINPEFRGRKLLRDACQFAMGFDLDGEGCFATAHPENISSQRILETLGFKADPLRQRVEKYGSVRNYYLFKSHDSLPS